MNDGSNHIIETVFNNHKITTILYEGKPHWPISDIGKVLKYKNVNNLSRKIQSGDWSKEFNAGKEYLSLKGGKLNVFKKQYRKWGFFPPNISSLLLLKEPGVYYLLGKTHQKKAIEFRWHLHREILPQLDCDRIVLIEGGARDDQLNGMELSIRKLKLEEKREDRLMVQAKTAYKREEQLMVQAQEAYERAQREDKEQRARVIEKLAESLKKIDFIDVNVFFLYMVVAAEIRSGADLSYMKPVYQGSKQVSEQDSDTKRMN